jgi:predicted GIY-YIG superfamily endonuclease
MADVAKPLAAAAARAPEGAGVYFFLAADTELLYVGKASSLRRRLWQHARAKPGAGGPRLDALYERVAEVRWEELPDGEVAEVREADLIVALRPAFNAGSALAGRWHYLLVEPAGNHRLRFRLATDARTETGGRVYGCFPHLGRGVGSLPGIACSDGYTALLRLLWAASKDPGDHTPSRLTRAAPDTFTTPVESTLRRPLNGFLSGTSRRLLDQLAVAGQRRAAYLQPGLGRDRDAAGRFFAFGPQALRRLRLRHGRPRGPQSRAEIETMLAAEVREAIGEFRLPTPAGATDAFLARKARRWASH